MQSRGNGAFVYLNFVIDLLEADKYASQYELYIEDIIFEDNNGDFIGNETKLPISGWEAINLAQPTSSNANCNSVNINWNATGYANDIYKGRISK